MVALKQLCTELKTDPREAREKLRIAVRDAKKNPEAREIRPAAVGAAVTPPDLLHADASYDHHVRNRGAQPSSMDLGAVHRAPPSS